MKPLRQMTFRTLVVLVMLTSWLFMLATSACVMPIVVHSPVQDTSLISDCDDVVHHVALQQAKTELQKQDCLLKPCLDAQQKPALFGKIAKLDIPVFAFWLVGLIAVVYRPNSFRIFRHWQNANFLNSVPIRYRFCVLLN